MPDKQSYPQGATRIARGGLNPDVFERAFTQDTAVTYTVQRHPSGKTEVFHPRLGIQITGSAEHDLFGYLLDGGRNIHLPLGDWGVRLPRRTTKKDVELLRCHGQALTIIEV